MHRGTKETTPFHIFKSEVATEAGISVDRMDVNRLHTAYDMGEAVWMVADEMKLRAQSSMPQVKAFSFPNINKVCVRRVKV